MKIRSYKRPQLLANAEALSLEVASLGWLVEERINHLKWEEKGEEEDEAQRRKGDHLKWMRFFKRGSF